MLLNPRTPLGRIAWLYAVVVGAAVLAPRPWIGWAFGAMLAYAVVTPLVTAFRQAWWAEMLLAAVGLGAVIPLASVLEALGRIRLREDALALLGPLVVFVVLAPVSGAIRLWRARRAR